MGTKRRSFLPFLSFPSFLSFQSFLPFLPLETFLSFFSFLPLESFQSFLTFLSFQALSVTALKRRATSPARGRGSPLRHSPLARPVPPLPHAGEANVTCRLQPPTFTGEVARRAGEGPRLRDCEAEARPADETAEAGQGQRSVFCKPAATGAAKTGHRNRGPQGRRGLLPAGTRPPRLRGNRPRTKGPVGPFRLHKAKETLLWLTALY